MTYFLLEGFILRAFWKRSKKHEKQNQNDINHEDTILYERPVVHTRMKRREYRKLQQEKTPKKTLDDYKLTAQEKITYIATTYILPVIILYIAFLSYHFLADRLLTRIAGWSVFWLLHLVYLGLFAAIMYIALARIFGRLPKITRYFGAVAWLGALYFYITFWISHTSPKGPILAGALLFVAGVVQLSGLNNYIKGGFILIAALYGNYLTGLSFPDVWLALGIGGLFILLGGRTRLKDAAEYAEE